MSKFIDVDKLIAEIERWRDKAKEKYNHNPYSMGRCDALAEFRNHIVSLQQEQPEVWIKIDEDHPLPYGQEVIGYNKEWVHEDFNPSGTRIGFLSDIGFQSAKWNNDQDCYDTPCEEGDDYILSQIQHDGTKKTWCKYENGEAVEGYLPNMPTHYMLIPKTPDGFAWPYNARKEE